MRLVEIQIFLLIQFRRLKKIILKKTDRIQTIQFEKKNLFLTKYI